MLPSSPSLLGFPKVGEAWTRSAILHHMQRPSWEALKERGRAHTPCSVSGTSWWCVVPPPAGRCIDEEHWKLACIPCSSPVTA
jgi:hypothetical protein